MSEGIKNNGHQEKQHDVTVKCIILSSLSEDPDQGDRDCIHERDLITGKRYFS